MKKRTILLLLVAFCSFLAKAQTTFTVRKNTKKPRLVSLSSASGAFYANVENKTVLTDTSSLVNNYTVVVSGKGNFVSGAGLGFSLFIDSTYINDTVTAFIGFANNLDTTLITTQKIEVRKLPKTVLALVGKPLKDTLSKSKVLKIQTLGTFVTDDYYLLRGSPYIVSSFELIINNKKYSSGVIKNLSSDILTTRMIKALKKAPIGSTIIFQNVQVCRPLAIHSIEGPDFATGTYEQRKKGLYCWPIDPITLRLVK